MNSQRREVVVIGGGISGLTAAWQLKKAGVDVCLLEARHTVGGCTRTEVREGYLLEQGPFNVMVRDPAFEELLDDFADRVRVVSAQKAAHARYIVRRGRLRRVPSNPLSLMATGLLSMPGRLRLIRGLCWSASARDEEETIQQAATRRIGREATDTFVSAVISGIFAGDIGTLSLPACFPSVARFDNEARSPLVHGIVAMAKARRTRAGRPKRRWPGLVSFDGGLGALTRAMGDRLGDDCFTECVVEGLDAVSGGYEISCRIGAVHKEAVTLSCKRVVVALPAHKASDLLDSLESTAADVMSRIPCASLAIVNLAYRRRDVGHDLNGFGFLVPRNEPDMPIMGAIWADSMFPHHAPADFRLIRVFVGGARDSMAVDRAEGPLVRSVTTAARDLLQLSGEPVLVDVCRHRAAIPQYGLGHRERIQACRAAMAARPGLHLIGNYLEGVSLNDCVRLASVCASEIIDDAGRSAAVAPRGAARDVSYC
ncbi:MAG: protoporphyrinogen oxidase [Phycisphaerae bacterium]